MNKEKPKPPECRVIDTGEHLNGYLGAALMLYTIAMIFCVFYSGCATSEKVIEIKNKPLCIQPERPPVTETIESFDIDDLEKAYLCIKSDVACDEKSKVIIWFLIKDYAYKLAKYDTYSQRWEEYGKCIERGYKNDKKEK